MTELNQLLMIQDFDEAAFNFDESVLLKFRNESDRTFCGSSDDVCDFFSS